MLFCQEVLDALASTDDAGLILLKRLCIAVDDEKTERVKALVRELANKTKSDNRPIRNLSDDFFVELMSRVVFLGLVNTFLKLRSWFIEGKQKEFTQGFILEVFIWDEVVERALAGRLRGQLDLAIKAWRIRFWMMKGLLIDLGRIREKAKQRSAALQAELAAYSPSDEYRPPSPESSHISNLIRLINDVIWGMQASLQVMLDHATIELENGGAGEELNRLKGRLQAQRKLFNRYNPKTAILIEGFVVTRTVDKRHGGRYLDALLPEKEAGRRSMDYDHFNLEGEDYPEERSVRLLEILRAREAQVDLLTMLYGQEREKKSGRLTAEARHRARIIDSKLNGKLQLRTDDDWVRYLAAAFQVNEQREAAKNGALGGAKNAAWETVMRDLFRYLQAFTGHPKFNLRDYGTSYLEVDFEFPRTVTGLLLHDCGVYAVRIAYMLSLVGQKIDTRRSGGDRLNLELRFVVLPNHVGLIIRGKDLSTYVTHNKSITMFSENQVSELQDRWRKHDEHGAKRAAPVVLDATQFWAELAAPLFIQGVNLPYALLTVPKPHRSAAATRKIFWKAYLRDVVGTPGRLFSRASESKGTSFYQFHLRYLDITVQEAGWYNRFIVPVWNKYWFKAWQDRGEELTRAFQALGSVRPIPESKKREASRFVSKRDDYIKHLQKPLDKIIKGQEPINDSKQKLNSELAAKPKALRRGVAHTWAARLSLRHGPLTYFDNYIADISLPVDQIKRFDPPPFATVSDLLRPAPE